MKKKYRDITVNDKQYAWAVQGIDSLVIWYNKKIVKVVDVSHITVTPKFVAETIKTL